MTTAHAPVRGTRPVRRGYPRHAVRTRLVRMDLHDENRRPGEGSVVVATGATERDGSRLLSSLVETGRTLDHQGVNEGLGQVASQLSLDDVVLFGEQPRRSTC